MYCTHVDDSTGGTELNIFLVPTNFSYVFLYPKCVLNRFSIPRFKSNLTDNLKANFAGHLSPLLEFAVTSTGNGSETVDDGISCADFPINEVDAVPQNSSETSQDSELSNRVILSYFSLGVRFL